MSPDSFHRWSRRIMLILLSSILIASLLPTHLLTHAAQIPLPSTTLTATWVPAGTVRVESTVTEGGTDSSSTDQQPTARCDHLFRHIPNTERIWLFGGHSNTLAFNESWFLDVSAFDSEGISGLVWHPAPYSAESDSVQQRWGPADTFLSSGIHPDDVGYPTSILFGGYVDSDTYQDDIYTFNPTTRTMRTIKPATEDGLNDGGAFARAFIEWRALPIGYGSGMVSSDDLSSSLFLFGGDGSSDGIRYSSGDHDHDDQWLYHYDTAKWETLDTDGCAQNSTTCTDRQKLYEYSQLKSLQEAYGPEGALNLSIPLRPAEVIQRVEQFLASITNLTTSLTTDLTNLDSTTMVNDPEACVTTCIVPIRREDEVRPPQLEGYRTISVNGNMYLYGGYSCSESGVQTRGGDACFNDVVWVLSYATMKWRRIVMPELDEPYGLYRDSWPSSGRAYHVMVFDEVRQLILIQGGAYQDTGAVWYFFNDVYAFDVTIEQFVPITIRGILPSLAWSSGASMIGNNMYLFGGCRDVTFLDTLHVLRMNVSIKSENCFASGSGLSTADAGVETSFTLQTREVVTWLDSYTNSTGSLYQRFSNTSSKGWYQNATYGSGLTSSITAQIVTTSSNSDVSLVQTKILEGTNGAYTISYTLLTGQHDVRLFVRFDTIEIPGSPFQVTLNPKPIPSPNKLVVSGWGMKLVELGRTATLLVQLRDEYGNEFSSKTDISNQTFIWTGMLRYEAEEFVLSITSYNNGNGTFTLSYDVPDWSEMRQFSLELYLNDESLSDSPFLIDALPKIRPSPSIILGFRVLAGLVMGISCIFSLCVFLFRNLSIMRSSSPNFMQLLLLGTIILSLSVIFVTIEEQDYGCQLFPTFLSIGLVMGMTSRIAKASRVSRIFDARKLRVAKNLSDAHLLVPTLGVILIMVGINVAWITINPLRVSWIDSNDNEIQKFASCSGSNSTIWLAVEMAYVGVIMMGGLFMAIKTSGVPGAFNESKLIAASVYNVIFCCLVGVPMLWLLSDSSTFVDGRLVLESALILWCAAFDVTALIGPKLVLLWQTREMTDAQRAKHISDSGAALVSTANGPQTTYGRGSIVAASSMSDSRGLPAHTRRSSELLAPPPMPVTSVPRKARPASSSVAGGRVAPLPLPTHAKRSSVSGISVIQPAATPSPPEVDYLHFTVHGNDTSSPSLTYRREPSNMPPTIPIIHSARTAYESDGIVSIKPITTIQPATRDRPTQQAKSTNPITKYRYEEHE